MTNRRVDGRLVFCLLLLAFSFQAALAYQAQGEETNSPSPGSAADPLSSAIDDLSGTESVEVSSMEAPILVAGQEVYRMRVELGPFSPGERAAAALRRIRELVTAPTFDPDLLQPIEESGQIRIAYGQWTLFTVLAEDYPEEERPDQEAAASAVARHLAAAIVLDRQARSPGRLAFASGMTLLALATMVALGWLILRAARWLRSQVVGSKGKVLKGIHLRGLELVSADAMVGACVRLVAIFRVAAILLVGYATVSIVLTLFPWTQPYGRASAGFVLGTLGQLGQAMIGFVPNLFIIVLTVVVIRYVNRFVGFLFDAVERGVPVIPWVHPELAPRTKQLVRLAIWILGLVVIFPHLPGSGTPAFRGVSVFIGLMVSLGSAGAIGNLVAGVVLTYTRAFSVGDRVRIADTLGDVVYHGMLSTKIVTIKNEEITIPNAAILGNHIINYTELAERKGLILHTTITIGYDVPWRRVHELLIAAAKATRSIIPQPEPFVLQKSLDDFYVSYELNAYTREASRMAVIYGELHQNIQDAFFAAGVEIMSPHYSMLRDGNDLAIPPEQRPVGYTPGAFRIRRGHKSPQGS